MKKILTFGFILAAASAFTACSPATNESGTTSDQMEIDTTAIEADTAVTLDPDTTLYHDMAI